MNKNLLINGEFNIAQRGTSFDSTTTPLNNDNTYLLDRWILLSDGNDVVDVSQVTDAPKGSVNAQKAVVQTANKKFGFVQVIENANCQQIVADIASLSLQAQTGAGAIRNIRAAVVSWNGTTDTVTSDVVSTWNAEGTDPTLAANWTYQNTPRNLSLSTSYQKYQIENIAINSGAKNVAVFIWVDDTDAAASDELYLGQIQLEKGSVVSDYEYRMQGFELSLALRYYERLNGELTGAQPVAQGGVANSTTIAIFNPRYSVEKRTTPAISVSSQSDFEVETSGGLLATTTLSFENISEIAFRLGATVTSGLTAGEAVLIRAKVTGNFMAVDSEL